MIVGVINGYYRSGTTAFQRYVELLFQNEIPVLHEPTNHEITYMLTHHGMDSESGLHGFKIFAGYKALEAPLLAKFMKHHYEVFHNSRNRGIMTSGEDLVYLLEPIHESEKPFVLKLTQASPVLNAIAENYDCWVINLVRDTATNVYNHFDAMCYFLTYTYRNKKLPFYGDLVFDTLTTWLQERVMPRHGIDKLVYNVLTCKAFIQQYSRRYGMTVVDFDEFVNDPTKYENKLPLPIDENVFSKVFHPSRLNPAPTLAVEIVEDSTKYMFSKTIFAKGDRPENG